MLTAYTFNNVKVRFGQELYAADYEIKVSNDVVNWTTVASITGADGGLQSHTIPGTNARYIRVKALKPDGGAGQSGTQMSIAELGVYNQ